MFLMTLIGSIIALLFALCGVIGGVIFFLDAYQGMDIKVFLTGFLMATWPLLAGCILFALLEVFNEIRALRLTMEVKTPSPAPSKPSETDKPRPRKTPGPAAAAHQEAPVYFPVRETPQGPRIARPAETEEHTPEPADKQDDLTFFKTR